MAKKRAGDNRHGRGRHPIGRREIYFVQGELTKLVKIGVSRNAETRVLTLMMQTPDRLKLLGVMPAESEDDERSLHERMGWVRLHGEWFLPVPVLMNLIGQWREPHEDRANHIRRRMAALYDRADWRVRHAGPTLVDSRPVHWAEHVSIDILPDHLEERAARYALPRTSGEL